MAEAIALQRVRLNATQAEVDSVIALMRRVDKGKPAPADLAELRQMFDKYPDLWRVSGDVVDLAAQLAIDKHVEQLTVRESMRRGYEEIKQSLGYDRAPGAERLLIEAVALAWLQYGIIHARYTIVLRQDLTIAQGDYHERKLDAAHRRYMRSLETLAKVRRLALPALQVNVAQPGARQLNVATGHAAE